MCGTRFSWGGKHVYSSLYCVVGLFGFFSVIFVQIEIEASQTMPTTPSQSWHMLDTHINTNNRLNIEWVFVHCNKNCDNLIETSRRKVNDVKYSTSVAFRWIYCILIWHIMRNMCGKRQTKQKQKKQKKKNVINFIQFDSSWSIIIEVDCGCLPVCWTINIDDGIIWLWHVCSSVCSLRGSGQHCKTSQNVAIEWVLCKWI